MTDERGYRRALLLVSVCLGIVLGMFAVLLFRYLKVSRYAPVSEAASIIAEKFYYYDSIDGEEALIDASLRGMVSGIEDTYASYYTAEEYDALLSQQSGNYVGVGIVMQAPDENGSLILTVYKNGPMDLAGVLAGDYILSVNGTPVAGMSLDDACDLFVLDEEQPDVLQLSRNGEVFEVSVLSAEIYVPYVTCRMLENSVGYMSIEGFYGNVVAECEQAISDLLKQGMTSLVIDLRDNQGGGLLEVLDISDMFLKKGDLIVSIKSRIDETETYYAEEDGYTFPAAVLVNGLSASASELLAGALQDHDRAVIIGTQTFGKGIVQTIYRLNSNGGWIRLTTDAYYTPNDVCIHGTGITPDIVVELPEGVVFYQGVELPLEEDTQLQEALKYLAG